MEGQEELSSWGWGAHLLQIPKALHQARIGVGKSCATTPQCQLTLHFTVSHSQ